MKASAKGVQRAALLGETNTWIDLQTNEPPTAVAGSFIDASATNGTSFYRIRVERL